MPFGPPPLSPAFVCHGWQNLLAQNVSFMCCTNVCFCLKFGWLKTLFGPNPSWLRHFFGNWESDLSRESLLLLLSSSSSGRLCGYFLGKRGPTIQQQKLSKRLCFRQPAVSLPECNQTGGNRLSTRGGEKGSVYLEKFFWPILCFRSEWLSFLSNMRPFFTKRNPVSESDCHGSDWAQIIASPNITLHLGE